MKRIATKGAEDDVYSNWRHVLCYTHRPRVKKAIRKGYNKRFRKIGKKLALAQA